MTEDTDSCLEADLEPEVQVLPAGTLVAQRYSIVEVLGHGGMGVVYKARQVHIDRFVALKMMLQETSATSADYRRFQREARAASQLDHPNLVRIHDFGYSDGQAYLCMDYLEGRSLETILKNGPLSLDRFRHIFGQVCNALQHAHEKGMVHRDLKPSNLMIVERPDQPDLVVVLDFGLVKMMNGGSDRKLTATNVVVGSPLYMSPEQCRAVDVDHRSDIYSLGCVMYEALTGLPPIDADTAFDVMNKHIFENPLSMREIAHGIYVPPGLERVIMQAMAKDPYDRQESMLALVRGIERSFSGAPDVVLSGSQVLKASHPERKGAETLRKVRRRRQFISNSIGIWIGVILLLTTGMALDELIHPKKRLKGNPGATVVHSHGDEANSSSDIKSGAQPGTDGTNTNAPARESAAPVLEALSSLPSKKTKTEAEPSVSGVAGANTDSMRREADRKPSAPPAAVSASSNTSIPAKTRNDSPAGAGTGTNIVSVRSDPAAGGYTSPPPVFTPVESPPVIALTPEQVRVEANVLFQRGRWSEARDKLRQLCSMSSISDVQAPALARLVVVTFNLQDYKASFDYLKEFKDSFMFNPRSMDNESSVLNKINSVSRQLLPDEDYAFSECLLKEIIDSDARQRSVPVQQSVVFKLQLSRIFSLRGKLADSESVLESALQDAEQIGDPNLVKIISQQLDRTRSGQAISVTGPGSSSQPPPPVQTLRPRGGSRGRPPGTPGGTYGSYGSGDYNR